MRCQGILCQRKKDKSFMFGPRIFCCVSGWRPLRRASRPPYDICVLLHDPAVCTSSSYPDPRAVFGALVSDLFVGFRGWGGERWRPCMCVSFFARGGMTVVKY